MEKKVLIERRGPVTVLILNRPEVRNCIDAEMAALLTEAIEGFAADREANVMVVTGAGERAFCAGADLKDIAAIVDRTGGTRRAPLGFSDVEPGKEIDARRALAMGLVQEVVPAGRALARALGLAERIAGYPQSSLRVDRASALAAPGMTLEDGLAAEARAGRAAEGDELSQGVRRFWERRGEGGAADALHP